MKHRTSSVVASASAAFALLLAAPASADAVSDWNAIAVQATLAACPEPICIPAIGAHPGPTTGLDVATVQAAVYDAVQAIENKYQPYKVEIIGASGSAVAAAAKAAHDVLVSRFPWQAAFLDSTYASYLTSHGLAADDPGVEVGAIAAAGIIALRASDGSSPVIAPPPFIGGTGVGDWRPSPPSFAPMAAPWMGSVTPFTLTRPSQFRAPPPPDFTSREYTNDYAEVMNLGALTNSARTPAQRDQANFWNLNYVVVLNQLLRDIASEHIDDIAESARLFASAVFRSLELFFDRDRMDFAVTTTNVGPTIEDTRLFKRFSDAREEVVNARIYEGIHFRFADEAGRKQGKQIARWAFDNYLRPVHDDNQDHDQEDGR